MKDELKIVPLGDAVTQMKTGSTPSTTHPEFFGGDVPWFTPGDIGSSKNLTASARTITQDAVSFGKTNIFEKGMLLLTCIGDIGRVGILLQRSSSNQQITALKFNDDIDVDFAYYWFISNKHKLVNSANQAIVPILNNERLSAINFAYPPLSEQKRIASLLARADRLRQLRRTAHDLGESLLQSVFLEMFGDPKTNSKKWEVEVIGEFVKPTKQQNPKSLGYSEFWYVDITSIDRQSKTIVEPKFLKTEDAPSRARKHISANDILVSTVRPNLNAVAKVPRHLDNQIASTGFCVLRPDTKMLASEYLFAIAQSKYFVDYLVKNETGANYPAVSDGIILDTPIPVPPLSLQEEFAGVVQRVEALRGRMSEAERQVEGFFESLLAESFRLG